VEAVESDSAAVAQISREDDGIGAQK